MPKTRKTKRRTKSQNKKQKNATESPPKTSDISTDPDTSPFKGYNENESPNIPIVADVPEDRDDIFDKLLDDGAHRRNLHKNIKTYSNKNKSRTVKENGLLEFNDCKNRDHIIQWLNNTQNVFERLTQTQEVVNDQSVDENLTLEMPSVSQRDSTSKVNRSHVRKRRSPYKLRARSLDIQIKKNVRRGRNERHSLAGDTPLWENYHIEELTGEEMPVPAGKEAAIIDLMEDEYLNNLEKEMLQHEEKKLQGWDRIKGINKSLSVKKQPKKLKIVVKPSPKKDTNLVNNNYRSYDYDVLENYFIDNMEKVMSRSEESKKDVFVIFENLLETTNDDEFVANCKVLYNKLKTKFEKRVDTQECSTQTVAVDNFDRYTQTDFKVIHVAIQTESNTTHTSIQTDASQPCHNCANNNNKFDNCDKNIQTEINLASVEAQTDDILSVHQTPSSEMFLDEKDKENLCEAFKTDFEAINTEKPEEICASAKSDDVFDDDILFTMNTEEFLNKETEASKAGNAVLDVGEQKTQESVIIVSKESIDNNKGVKRTKPDSPVEAGASRSKRPCAKFIRDDLSVGFSTCVEEDTQVTEESEDLTYDEYLKKLCNKHIEKKTPKTRTQEQIEELENLIHDITKPKRRTSLEQTTPVAPPHKSPTYSDYFKTDPVIETTPKKIRRDLFDSKKLKSSESMFGSEENETVVANRTLTRDNVDKIKILEDVVVKRSDNDETTDQFYSLEADFVESTPQKNHQREQLVLDITLPPPLEFQDTEQDPPKVPSSPRRPLAVLNKITSTPISQRYDSEKITLSPICVNEKTPKSSPNILNQENCKQPQKRVLGAIELAQQSKFTPLTIIKKPLSQNLVRSATPKQKSILNYVRPSQESQEDSSLRNKPCIACSRISREQVVAISSLTNKKLASYSTSFSPKVTHLIVSVNEKNCLKDHTIKFVSAVAAGIWVLHFGWVQECLRRNILVPEEPYEVLDVSGLPGPQQSRLNRITNPLFKGYKIYAAPPFISTTQQEVENVVRLLGGRVVSVPEALLDKNGFVCVIVTEARATQDFELYETWLDALKVATVDIEWISRSVGQYRLLSLRPFTLCSDEVLDNLGYPSELTVNMTYSFSQQTFSTVPSTN